MQAKRSPTANPNAFAGKSTPPTAKEVKNALGQAQPLWEQLLAMLADELKLTTTEWGSSSPKLGWSLRVKRGDRIIVYLAPLQGSFQASFALGEKAVQAAVAGDAPVSLIKLIQGARKYAEGTAVRVQVHCPEDVALVRKLAEAKVRN